MKLFQKKISNQLKEMPWNILPRQWVLLLISYARSCMLLDIIHSRSVQMHLRAESSLDKGKQFCSEEGADRVYLVKGLMSLHSLPSHSGAAPTMYPNLSVNSYLCESHLNLSHPSRQFRWICHTLESPPPHQYRHGTLTVCLALAAGGPSPTLAWDAKYCTFGIL